MKRWIVVLCILIAGAVTVSSINAPLLGDETEMIFRKCLSRLGYITFTNPAGETETINTTIDGVIYGQDSRLAIDGQDAWLVSRVRHGTIISATSVDSIREQLTHSSITEWNTSGYSEGVFIIRKASVDE